MNKQSFNFIKSGVYAIMAIMMAGTMASCSEDKESSFDTPKYAAEAAKYVIDDNNAAYEYVELTESGNYIISPKYSYYGSESLVAQSRNTSALKNRFWGNGVKTESTRAYSEILYGKYTKTGDNEYKLEGYGTMTITKDATDSYYSLVLAPTGRQPQEYTSHKDATNIDDNMSNKLCRTWEIDGYRLYAKMNGKTMLDITAGSLEGLINKLTQQGGIDPDDLDLPITEDNEPEEIIFTKAGTYVVFYANEELAVSTWKWKDVKKGLLRYCWNPEWIDDPNMGGDVKIEFKDNKLYLTENASGYEEGYSYEAGMTYILHEVK